MALVLVGIVLIVAGIVLIASVVFAPVYFNSPNLSDPFPPAIRPGSSYSHYFPTAFVVGLVLVISGSIMLINGALLLRAKPNKCALKLSSLS